MKEIEKTYLPKNSDLSSLDALDVLHLILYKYSNAILSYKTRMLLHDDPEDLHKFRVNIRKSRAFLKEFAFLFPEEQYTYFSENLKEFATQTNQKRDLDVIEERLEALEIEHGKLQEEIDRQRDQEQQHIREMLQSKAFEDFFHTYQNTLKKEKPLTAENNQDTIDTTARKVIQKRHRKIVKKIEALEKEPDSRKLHKIRISLKKLRYMLEEFQHIFGEEKSEKMINKGKKLQTLLGDYNDTVNQATLIHNYLASHAENLTERRALEESLLKETSKDQKKLLHEAMKELHRFKAQPFSL
ncbi:MAG TPA: CHAD domain-containing protein [Sulfurovum sp.]|uniref:CHAD domain-containing protein n=1 Tax=Sulfurovum sp. TaxID=1969726 RepID=UPI002F91FDAD